MPFDTFGVPIDNKVWVLPTTFFFKSHKSRRICEVLLDVAKFQRKRCRIERDIQGELRVKEKEEEKKAIEE